MTVSDLKARIKDPTEAERQLLDRYESLDAAEAREHAFDVFAGTGLPHRRMEQWKWTDVRQALPKLSAPEQTTITGLTLPANAIVLNFDGRGWSYPTEPVSGLSISEKKKALPLSEADVLPLGALTAALTGTDGLDTLHVEVTGHVDRPVVLEFAHGEREAAFARISFDVHSEAEFDLIERHSGGAGLNSVLLEFNLHRRAKVSRTLVQSASRSEAVAVTAVAHLAEEAQFSQTALGFGAKVARIETRLSYDGPNAQATLNAAYLAADGYHVDFTTHVRHGAESCVTRQLTKGAVSKGGRGVFQGKFLVPRTVGQFTDADMQHQALLLENGAEVFAKPELEIYADDVECEHGNTSGQLDETALFYMRQRGIALREARALLTEAFIAEALEQASDSVRAQMIETTQTFLRQARDAE